MRDFKVGDVVTNERDDDPQIPKGFRAKIYRIDADGDIWFKDVDGDERVRPGHHYSIFISDPINHPSQPITGGRVNYYLARIEHPQREDQTAYTAECEDIISALAMTFDEANIFKEIWRSSNARLGNGKPDHKALYGAEKINHYAGRNLRRHQREAQK